MDFLSTTGNFLLILLGFGFLIFVHELGHFLAARWANIRVDNFAIGMGPVVASFRKGVGFRFGTTDREVNRRHGCIAAQMSDRELAEEGLGETEYTLRALPLGGYVRMVGQEDGNPEAVSDSPRGYQRCPIWKRMVVVSAGVVMNLITAVILFWIAFAIGVRFPAPILSVPDEGSPAALAPVENLDRLSADDRAKISGVGVRPGDRVIEIDGEPVATLADIQLAAAMSKPGTSLHLLVERHGIGAPLEFTMLPKRSEMDGLLRIGAADGPTSSATITDVATSRDQVNSELRRSGLTELAPGATLLSYDDIPVRTLDEMAWAIIDGEGAPVSTTWRVPGKAEPVVIKLTPAPALSHMSVPSAEAGSASDAKSRPTDLEGLIGLSPLIAIGEVAPEGANPTTIRPGDLILKAGDITAPNFADLRRITSAAKGKTLPLRLLRDGAETELEARVSSDGKLGFVPRYAIELPRVATPVEATIAAKSATKGDDDAPPTLSPTPVANLGIAGGSTIAAVNGAPVANWAEFRGRLRAATTDARARGSDGSVSLAFTTPSGERVEHTVQLDASTIERFHTLGWRPPFSLAIFDPNFVLLKATDPLHAVTMGLSETKKMIQQVYLTLDRLIRGSIGIDKLNGPVGIFHIGVKVADQGFTFLIFFIALLSVNLAVMNFLPLPIVDGGLFLFLVYERIVGKPPSIGFQNAATAVGLLLIGSIFVITFFNDVARLIG